MLEVGSPTMEISNRIGDDLIVEISAPLIRENNCVQLVMVLEEHDGQAWSVNEIAEEAMMPETTARRLLFPELWERRTMTWFMSLRARENLSDRDPASEFTTQLVESYYGHMLANFTYLGVIEGKEYIRVNTSQFELLQRIGAKYDYYVTFDPTIGIPGQTTQGRARARYVGPAFRWSGEDRLNREGYRVRWRD